MGAHRARLDDGDLDAERAQLGAHAVREGFEGELAGVVPATHGRAEFPRQAGDVDDAPSARLAHRRQEALGQGGEAEDVDVELATRPRQGRLLEGPELPVPGVVDQDLDGSALRLRCCDGAVDAGLVAEVQVDGYHAGQLGYPLHAASCAHYRVTLLSEHLGRAGTEPGGCSGDEDGPLTVNVVHSSSTLL